MRLETATLKILLVALLALLSLSQASRVSAGYYVWTSNGPGGGSIRALAIDPLSPSTVYAGTPGGGVLKSTNGGATWSASNNGLTNANVRALAIDPRTPNTVYAGIDSDIPCPRGVFKSTNGGANFGLSFAIPRR